MQQAKSVNLRAYGKLHIALTTIRFLKAIKSDIILQNKYEGGWFTAASVLNAFDLSGDNNFSRVCSPLADVAGEIIYSSISEGDIATAINEMTNAEIFDNDEIDGDTLYSLSLEYRYILSIFTNMR